MKIIQQPDPWEEEKVKREREKQDYPHGYKENNDDEPREGHRGKWQRDSKLNDKQYQ